MDISQQYLWPLAGVLLGWLLSAISGGWKSRSERKKLIGRILSKLLVVCGDVRLLKNASDHFKDLSDGAIQYERFRQRLYSHHFLEPSDKSQDLIILTSNLSEYYPFEATRLQSTIHLLMKAKDAKIGSASESKDTYIRLLSMHEVGIDACDKELTRIVSSLALKHGLVTRLKLWKDRQKKNSVVSGNNEFLRMFAKETIDGIRDRT